MITLRPHHGLCLRNFVGNGYNEAFVENMTHLITKLNEDTAIHLVTDRDDVCSACPNWKDGKCLSQNKVMEYDKGVLDAIGYRTDTAPLTYGEFQKQIEERIIQQGRFHSICGDCEWRKLCHNKL